MAKSGTDKQIDNSRRGFIKKAAYIAPVVLTMTAVPSFASSGSGSSHGGGRRPHRPRNRYRPIPRRPHRRRHVSRWY